MIVGIDLHNIRDGGGVNYIRNLLENAKPELDGFTQIYLFGASRTLADLPNRTWLHKHSYDELERGLLSRLWFVWRKLPAELRAAKCNVLYAPGGVAFGNFRPYVTISRNMLPFQPTFWEMYPWISSERTRLRFLRRLNTSAFSRADGMIYLSETARSIISPLLRKQPPHIAIISHGVNHDRFTGAMRQHTRRPADTVTIVYPSRLEPYKHQLELISAIESLRHDFPQLRLTMIGQSNPSYLRRVQGLIREVDPKSEWIQFLGEVPNGTLPRVYAESDLLVFASSCENLPNILIEAMACGIPICCSDRSPMPEIARDACLYFDPTSPAAIAAGIRATLADREGAERRSLAGMAYAQARSWQTTARQTFALIASAARQDGRGTQQAADLPVD